MRTRTETRTRQVAHTIDGHTELVDETYTVDIPRPPLDWDRVGLAAVTASTALVVLASVGWSTASIGDLLDRTAPAAAAYSAAGVFDLLWINCLILEWLARYDPDRAALPRRAGHLALGVAMAAICLHGHLTASFAVGLVAAAVSALAKAGWTLTLRAYARPLDPRTQAWLAQRQARIGAQLALSAQLRHLGAVQARAAVRTAPDASPDMAPDAPEGAPETPDTAPQLPATGPMTMADAVRTAVSCGITEPEAVIRYVRKVADANAKEDSVLRTLRMARRTA